MSIAEKVGSERNILIVVTAAFVTLWFAATFPEHRMWMYDYPAFGISFRIWRAGLVVVGAVVTCGVWARRRNGQ